MAYHAKSQKSYNEKCNRITLKYTEKELHEYLRLMEYINSIDVQKTVYIKSLIKSDLDSKGIPYHVDLDSENLE